MSVSGSRLFHVRYSADAGIIDVTLYRHAAYTAGASRYLGLAIYGEVTIGPTL
jgi:hypothetical protein